MVKSGDQHVPGSNYATFAKSSVASVGADFDVAFYGGGGGTPSFGGIFVDRSVTTIVQNPTDVFLIGDQLNLLPIGNPMTVGNIDATTPPAIGPGGHVAHAMIVNQPGGPNPQALLRKNPGPGAIDLVSFDGKEVVPGVPGDLVGVAALPFGLDSTGQVGFRAGITGGTAILRADLGGLIQVVARTNDAAPGMSGQFDLIAGATNNELAAEFNSQVRSAFTASLKNPFGRGVWRDTGTGLTLIADDVLPPTGSSVPFNRFGSPTINNSGAVAFRGCFNASCSDDGIWATGTLGLVRIAADADPAPNAAGSTQSGDKFSGFSNPVVGSHGELAFRATVSSPPPTSREGIWIRTASGFLRRLAFTGDPLRGTGLTFSTFGADIAAVDDPGVVDSMRLAFTAVLSDGKTGLFATSEFGSIVKVAKVDDAFEVTPTDSRVISFIDFYPGSAIQGNSGLSYSSVMSPRRSALVYKLAFADMTQAVVLTTLED